MANLRARAPKLLLIATAASALAGCGGRDVVVPTQLAPAQMTQIGVNAYLWQAAVDTVSFAPLLQADASSGVVITDWYASPNAPGERIKLTVAILDSTLRANALRVSVAKQVNNEGLWVDAPVTAATVQKLEDIILTRARDIRRTTVAGG